jgi:hypothetical protein
MRDPDMSKASAIALYESGWWKLYPARDAALAQLGQARLCMPYDDYRRIVEDVGDQGQALPHQGPRDGQPHHRRHALAPIVKAAEATCERAADWLREHGNDPAFERDVTCDCGGFNSETSAPDIEKLADAIEGAIAQVTLPSAT